MQVQGVTAITSTIEWIRRRLQIFVFFSSFSFPLICCRQCSSAPVPFHTRGHSVPRAGYIPSLCESDVVAFLPFAEYIHSPFLEQQSGILSLCSLVVVDPADRAYRTTVVAKGVQVDTFTCQVYPSVARDLLQFDPR